MPAIRQSRSNDPDAEATKPKPMQCPRCDVALRAISMSNLDEVQVHLCDRCEGTWYPLGSLTAVGQTSRLNVSQTDLGVSLVADKATDLEPDACCPVCRERMNRFTFSLAPEVKLDECIEHGTWLDDGELGAILDSIDAAHADIAALRQSRDQDPDQPFAFTLRVLNALLSHR